MNMPDGENIEKQLDFGEICRIPLREGQEAEAVISPGRHFDVGAGPGKSIVETLIGGVVGIVIDARGRPFKLPESRPERKRKLIEWMRALDLYPEEFLEKMGLI